VFKTVLVANRGEIAVRIARTFKAMGIRSMAIHSTADRNSAHVTAADAAVELPDASAADTYLRGDLIIAAAKAQGAEAVIPGYGSLAENADFAEACAAAGLTFVDPTPVQMRDFGLKHAARALLEKAGVPLTPGTGLLGNLGEARAAISASAAPCRSGTRS
jgi:urea carboxylase